MRNVRSKTGVSWLCCVIIRGSNEGENMARRLLYLVTMKTSSGTCRLRWCDVRGRLTQKTNECMATGASFLLGDIQHNATSTTAIQLTRRQCSADEAVSRRCTASFQAQGISPPTFGYVRVGPGYALRHPMGGTPSRTLTLKSRVGQCHHEDAK